MADTSLMGDPRLTRARLLTVRQVAGLLACGQRTVRRWIADGVLPSVRLSKRAIRVPLLSVERLIESAARIGAGVAGENKSENSC